MWIERATKGGEHQNRRASANWLESAGARERAFVGKEYQTVGAQPYRADKASSHLSGRVPIRPERQPK